MQKAGRLGLLEYAFALYYRYKTVLRFAAVGCVNTGADFLSFTMLHSLFGIDKLVCQTAGYSLGIVNSFILNKLWTFENRRAGFATFSQALRFVTVNLSSLGITLLGLKLLNENLGLNVYASKVVVTAAAQVVNYMGYKLWVFGVRRVRLT